ncbi:tRNA (adenine(22)-N(1))-methyltransferase [Shewanella youngdeokensis]|uniref:tRNA (Adenine(22)-N(1))-methyltransferase TrmK n=1 Tax=Shewanella youngdeokensis TaxID=2999068 RepID=A0ABZ0K251_9GAMM|nr:tRNA (adenine(22)-N(1))-methyltransferase TrmK [Shewanella sp. DAU334]
MKLSPRLQKINSMVQPHYDHIWDCCCDHGLLGAALLQRLQNGTVHFVDVVPELMQDVTTKLERFFPVIENVKRWQVHCIDVALLPLADKSQSQLVIIAGVGGELLIELVQAIVARFPQHSLEFILCPVHHIFEVRTALSTLKLGLIDEHLVEDNQRFYEVLHVSTGSAQVISPVGSQMWNLSQTSDQRYLQKTLAHYQRLRAGLLTNPLVEAPQIKAVESIISAYRTLETSDKVNSMKHAPEHISETKCR